MLSSLFKRPIQKYGVAICCIAKNEDPYFKEWIDYHAEIGVSQFYIYDNESAVPISTTLASYIQKGLVTVESISGTKMQMEAHRHCLANHGRNCEWIAFIDVDEFIVPKTVSGNLVEFLKPYKKYGGLGINWLIFGSNGHLDRPERPQVESYTRRSLVTQSINRHIKSIVQPKYVKKVPKDPHHFYYRFPKYCVNENFQRIKGAFADHTSNKIQLNHYFVRSLDEFKMKVARGRADSYLERTVDEFYSVNEFANMIADETIKELRLIANTRAEQ